MKLSIITVNLNNRDGLQKTIDSVVSQTFRDFEWIVIDGGSTDGSKELIEQYAEHFAYWVSEPDKGVYNAMNKGIKVAKGDYLQFLNSGDWLCDVRTLQRVFRLDYDEDIVFSNKCIMCSYDGTSIVIEREYGNRFTPFNIVHKTINHQSAFIRRILFDRFGYYDESYKIIADRKFFFDAILCHNATTAMLDFIVVFMDAEGISSTEDSSHEKERLICEYMPVSSVSDYYEHIRQLEFIKKNQHAFEVYSELRKHRLIRKVMHFLYRVFAK